jgi:hypothetical protein
VGDVSEALLERAGADNAGAAACVGGSIYKRTEKRTYNKEKYQEYTKTRIGTGWHYLK